MWITQAALRELQRLSGASVYARASSAEVLRTGKPDRNDPQFKSKSPPVPPAAKVWNLSDEQLLGIGSIRLRVIPTPGHTPGGTTWIWESCEANNCLNMVYADSLSPVASEGFKFSAGGDSGAGADLQRSIARIEKLPCDVLISAHPNASGFMERMANRPADNPQGVKDDTQCKQVRAGRARCAGREVGRGSAGKEVNEVDALSALVNPDRRGRAIKYQEGSVRQQRSRRGWKSPSMDGYSRWRRQSPPPLDCVPGHRPRPG